MNVPKLCDYRDDADRSSAWQFGLHDHCSNDQEHLETAGGFPGAGASENDDDIKNALEKQLAGVATEFLGVLHRPWHDPKEALTFYI